MGGAIATWGRVDDRESVATIHAALDLGVRLIDTAPIYGLGHSEEIVGRALVGRRKEVVLATKCGLLFPSNSQSPRRCLTRDNILREIDHSLRRLQTDWIDLYQCHWPDPDTPLRETMGAMSSLFEQGAIRAIGLSNFSGEQIRAALEFGPVHALQTPFSILQTRAGEDLFPFCAEHRIAVLAYSPLAKGLLTGKFAADDTFEDLRAKDPEFLGNRFHRNLRLVQELSELATPLGRTTAQLALNWVANHPGVTAAIVGAKRPSQINENVEGVGWSLSSEIRQQIDRLAESTMRES